MADSKVRESLRDFLTQYPLWTAVDQFLDSKWGKRFLAFLGGAVVSGIGWIAALFTNLDTGWKYGLFGAFLAFSVVAVVIYLTKEKEMTITAIVPDKDAPQLELREVRVHHTTTNHPLIEKLYVQVLPRCSTRIEGCQGFLLRVQKWDTNNRNWRSTELNQPLDLVWSFHDTAPRTLLPGIDQWLNLFWISNAERRVHLDTVPVPSGADVLLNYADTFRFDVRVIATNCAAADISVRVRIGDRWDVPEVIEKL